MDIEPYLSDLRSHECSENTIIAYRSDLELFEAFLREKELRITQVKPSTITAFIEFMKQRPNTRFGRPGCSAASVRRRIAVISSYFDWLRATSLPKLNNPTSILRRKLRVHNDECKAPEITFDTALSVIDNPRDRAIIALFLTSGIRLSELHQLNWDSIGWEEYKDRGRDVCIGTGRVIGKGNKERDIFFDEATVNILREYRKVRTDDLKPLFLSERRQRLSKRAIQNVVYAWSAKLGMGRIHPHQLRHQFAFNLANACIDAISLQTLMGHSSFSTTQRYFRLKPETLARSYFAAMEIATR